MSNISLSLSLSLSLTHTHNTTSQKKISVKKYYLVYFEQSLPKLPIKQNMFYTSNNTEEKKEGKNQTINYGS
jgi:hypothetical protein